MMIRRADLFLAGPAVAVVWVALLSATAEAAMGQSIPVEVSAATALADFEEGYAQVPPNTAKAHAAQYMVFRASRFQASAVDSILDGLERMVISSSSSQVRQAAARWVAIAGESMDGAREPIPGTVARIERLYTASTDVGVRTTLVAWMHWQAERRQAMDFLEEATQDSRPDERGMHEPPALWAVQALAHMDTEEARDVLRRLHASGRGTAAARAHLEYLARWEFKRE